MIRPPPTPTLFPYTTLFRSHRAPDAERLVAVRTFLEDRGHERERRRGEQRGAEALDGARHHEPQRGLREAAHEDRKSTRLNSSHPSISYAVFCLKKKNKQTH